MLMRYFTAIEAKLAVASSSPFSVMFRYEDMPSQTANQIKTYPEEDQHSPINPKYQL
jgi:hypothetical protein